MFNRRYLPPVSSGGSSSKLPYIYANRVTNQSIPNNSYTQIIFNNLISNDASYFSLNIATGLVTILQTGVYNFTLNTVWSASAVGIRQNVANLTESATLYQFFSDMVPANLTIGLNTLSFLFKCNVINDTIGFFCYQNTGAALNLGTGNVALMFTIIRLSDV